MTVIETLPPFVAVACGALLFSIVALWLRPRWLWFAGLIAAGIAGLLAGILSPMAFAWAILLASAILGWRTNTALRWVALPAIVALSVLLAMHVLPGFSNPQLAGDVVLSRGAAPYSLYFNFDKSLAGILLLGIGSVALSSPQGWGSAFGRALPLIVVNVIIAMVLSLMLGYVRFEPHWTPFFWTWALVNLLLTCMSEEAIFRGFIQRELRSALGGRPGAASMAVAASAILFGVAHAAGGWRYVLLATVAGAGYALVYERTRRIEMSMLAHFLLNATHFLLFTYPYVQR